MVTVVTGVKYCHTQAFSQDEIKTDIKLWANIRKIRRFRDCLNIDSRTYVDIWYLNAKQRHLNQQKKKKTTLHKCIFKRQKYNAHEWKGCGMKMQVVVNMVGDKANESVQKKDIVQQRRQDWKDSTTLDGKDAMEWQWMLNIQFVWEWQHSPAVQVKDINEAKYLISRLPFKVYCTTSPSLDVFP